MDAFGVSATFAVIGTWYVLVTLFGLFNRAFRELDRRS